MEKKTGKYKLKQQVGAQEFAANVEVEVEIHDWEHDTQYAFPDGRVICATGASYGAKYAIDYARGYGFLNKSFRIEFKSIKGTGPASAEPLVAVAAAMAVFDALGIKPERPPLLDSRNKFASFPI
jgi:hypothetical protein